MGFAEQFGHCVLSKSLASKILNLENCLWHRSLPSSERRLRKDSLEKLESLLQPSFTYCGHTPQAVAAALRTYET